MSLDSEDETTEIEVCNEASKDECRKVLLEVEMKSDDKVPQESCSEKQSISVEERKSSLISEDVQSAGPASINLPVPGDKRSVGQECGYNNFGFYQSSQQDSSQQFTQFNVLTHQSFLDTTLGTSCTASQNQTQNENYFVPGYSQNVNSISGSNSWDNQWNVNSNTSGSYTKGYK